MTTPRIAALTAAALLTAAGCAIPYGAAPDSPTNTCSSDADCADGSSCYILSGEEGTCVAGAVDLPDLVLEIRPPAGSVTTNSTLVSPGALVSKAGTQVITLPIDLPPNVDVDPGRIYLPCAPDTPVPAAVSLLPVAPLAGLLTGQSYDAHTELRPGGEAFSISVPPGAYNLYIQPQLDPAAFPDCVASPPIFLPAQALDKNAGYSLHASAPLHLTGSLKLSEKEDFTKWYLDVVEPYSGRTISEVVQPKQEGIALEVPISVWFDWTATAEAFTPIVRLRPPEGEGKPVIHWRLDAIALQGVLGDEVPVKLDLQGIDTKARVVKGGVYHGTETVPSTVTLRSRSVSGDELTRFTTVVDTDASGQFEAAVPPGDYQIVARPYDTRLAVGTTDWTIEQSDDCFCANSVEVQIATTLAGSVALPSGEPAQVEVRLTPSAADTLPYLGSMLLPDVVPRSAYVDTVGGDFQVTVDPGTFDLSLVPPTASGYPWLVRPRLFVPTSETDSAAVISLTPFALQDPVVVRGALRAPSGALLPGAIVRAWVANGEASADLSRRAVQIGETVTDDTGSYVLLLPPSLKEGE